MAKLKTIITGFLVIVFYIGIGILADGHHTVTFPFTLLFVFIGTIIYSKINKLLNVYNCFFLILPIFLLFLISGFFIDNYSRIIPYLIFIPISSLLAVIYLKIKKIIIIPLSIFLFYLANIYAYNTIFIYISNINAEKNIIFPKVNFVNYKNVKINFSNDKIIVLDFWSTTCGICFDKFPDFERTYNKYKNNKNLEFYVVNVPIERRDKFENTIKILDSIGYKFPKLYAKSSIEIEKQLHFNTFPHLIIIKNGKIRYDGMFETKSNTFIFSVESEIENLQKE